jgi:endonuclease YncB( thermonuclease family)
MRIDLFVGVVVAMLISGLSRVHASDIVGTPSAMDITDGDTVIVARTKIRLLDLDAPETDQICLDRNGEFWRCGIAARDALIKWAATKQWTCHLTGQQTYNRSLASCFVDNEDVSEWMVRAGWAMSPNNGKGYSHRFDADERLAREGKNGIWSGAFIAPWNWRTRNCKTEILGATSVPIDAQRKLCGSPAMPPDPNCTIKATLRSNACIYHLPGDHYYGPLKMSGSNKRWFCSEEEAQAAGCRPSRR